MNTELVFEGATKFYGPVIGVNNVSLRIGPGITGLVGANGAGKSTLLKLAAGHLRPSQGLVRVGPHRAGSLAARRILGYTPDVESLYESMTGRRFVVTMARLHGFTRRQAEERAGQALEEVGMAARAQRKLSACSHGMRQRIKLAQALVHDPHVLVLDEPLLGIDPRGRREIHEVLLRLARAGKTILLSSHILVEVEQIADTVVIVARGRVVATGTLADIRRRLDDQPLTVQLVTRDARRLAGLLVLASEVSSVDLKGDEIVARIQNPDRFFRHLGDLVIEHGIQLRGLQTLDASAEAVFGYLERAVN